MMEMVMERMMKNGTEFEMNGLGDAERERMQTHSFSLLHSSSKLRPRKEGPTFRKVNLDDNDFDRIVGKRVKVYWSGSRKWFTGRIRGFDKNKRLHFILYDDGDKEELDLGTEKFELEVLPAEGFKVIAEPVVRRKSRGLNGSKYLSGTMKKDSDKASGSKKEATSKEAKKQARRRINKSQKANTKSLKAETAEESPNTINECSTDVPMAKCVRTHESSTKTGHVEREIVLGLRAQLSSPQASSIFRPRKEMPVFQMVELADNDLGRIVGKRVKVYWSGSRKWFTGRIEAFDGQKRMHYVLYDDGDKEELNLKNEKFKVEILPTEGYKVKAESYSNITRKSVEGGESISGRMKEDSAKDGHTAKETRSKKKKATKKQGIRGTNKSVQKDTKSVKAEDIETSQTYKTAENQISVEDSSTDMPIAVFMKSLISTKKRKLADREMMQANLVSPCISSSKLRPRKETPSFRLVDLDESDSERIVGKRIKVYWSGSRKWFTGRVRGFDGQKKLHFILYDDGDKEELDLKKEQFELEIRPAEGFKLAEPYSRKKRSLCGRGDTSS